MKRFLAILAIAFAWHINPAQAQKTPSQIASEIQILFADNSSGQITPEKLRTVTTDLSAAFPSILVPSGHIFVGSAGGLATQVALSGDCSMAATGAITCTKTGGVNFGPLATAPAVINSLVASNAAIDGTKLSYTPPLTGSTVRNITSKLSDYVTITDFGGKSDGTTDNSAAFTAAFNALPNGGVVYLPQGPSCYGVNTTITLPASVPVELRGDGRASTCIKALASMTQVILKGTNFTRGYGVRDLMIDGNNLVSYNIYFQGGAASTFQNLYLYNATSANVLVGNGVSNTQENIFQNVRADNLLCGTTLSCLPDYNFWIKGINNHFTDTIGSNAKTANYFSDTTAAGNHYVNGHGYSFPVVLSPTYNFLINGSFEQVVNFEADGATTSDVRIGGFANTYLGGFHWFDAISATIGITLDGSTSGNTITGNVVYGTSAANAIVQNGGTNLNQVCNNSAASVPAKASYSNFCDGSSGGGGTPGGSNTQVQFNGGGSFGGSANLTWVSPQLTIGVSGTLGKLAFGNASSGLLTVQPATGALGTNVVTLPNATDTLVGKATTDTLTNKTLTAPVISSIVNTGTLTLPTSTDTLVGRATADTLTNKTLDTAGTGNIFKINGTTINAISGNTSKVASISGSLTSGNCIKSDASGNLIDAATTCGGGGGGSPGGSDTQVQFNNAGSFGGSANLTWVSPQLTIGVSGTLGKLAFGNATSGLLTIQPGTGALTTNVLTLPNATDTLVGKATTDALTNKTYNGLTVTTSTGTLTVANSKTLTFNNSLTFAGTDSTTMTFPGTSDTLAGLATANTFTAGQTITGSSAFFQALQATSTDAGSGSGPQMVFFRNSASPAALDDMGIFVFRGKDSGNNNADYIYYFSRILDPTDGSEDGALIFRGMIAGADQPLMQIGAGLAVGSLNDPGRGTVGLMPQTFASLTTCSSTIKGAMAAVTDSNANTWGATVAGSGSNNILAFCNGTNWTVAGK